MTDREIAELAAPLVHAANNTYCRAIGETPSLPWEELPETSQRGLVEAIERMFSGESYEQAHGAWMALRLAEGWRWGPEKDPRAKVSPALVPYHLLPPEQLRKDTLRFDIATALQRALNPTPKPAAGR